MSILSNLNFAKALPAKAKSSRAGKSPLEKAKEKLSVEIGYQISLNDNPKFMIVKETKKRGSGKVIKSQRAPRSWVTVDGDTAYITPRFSNKPLNVGGKRGSYIACAKTDIGKVLGTLSKWALSDEANDVLEKAMKSSKRKSK